ncbi:MAG: RNA 3'-terminal phosphate cyclase [Methanomicrobiaceae archaeon]|nr:RNA 3'-terminal phosphate cyclase [Methanomicrobiaceae archaeon]MDD5418331.1 RNA 3'-terminal phosphate cyclase [Methanomicrobiaceae archaeon]
MLTIDGSYLEGGGQIVRTAVALSAVTGTPVTLERIRERRERPGLAAQHVAAVSAVGAACGAAIEGLAPGSRQIVFHPGPLERRDVAVDLGTAGSIPLVLQAWLPVALHAGGSLSATGGTEVRWSPTIDYVDRVLAAVLRRHGGVIDIAVLQRGYYPQGGGRVAVRVEPSHLFPIVVERADARCGICSCSSNLPEHVTERQAASARRVLSAALPQECDVHLDPRTGGGSTGSSLTVWAGAKGGTALGRRGLAAENVGEQAARRLLEEVRRPGTVDLHLSDQLLIYLAQYGGRYSTHALSMHARTICWLLERFGFAVRWRENGAVEFAV